MSKMGSGSCCVPHCNVSFSFERDDNCKRRFFNIPSVIMNQCDKTFELSSRRRALWIARVNKSKMPLKPRFCSRHFVSGQPSHLFDDSNVDWAPTLLLNKEKDSKTRHKKNKVEKKKLDFMLSETPEHLVIEPTLPEMLEKSETCSVLREESQEHEITLAMTCEPDTVLINVDPVLPNSKEVNEMSCQTLLTGDYIEKIEHENLIMKQEWKTLKSSSNTLIVKMW